MLNDFTGADQVYIVCGYTDLRKGIVSTSPRGKRSTLNIS